MDYVFYCCGHLKKKLKRKNTEKNLLELEGSKYYNVLACATFIYICTRSLFVIKFTSCKMEFYMEKHDLNQEIQLKKQFIHIILKYENH